VSVDLPPAIYEQAVSVALPSLDGIRGVDASYEHALAPSLLGLTGLALLASGEARESATGDYTGARLGVGLELRWYWRAGHRAWLSRLAPNNLAGWFVGAEALVATDLVHDNADHRWLGTSLQLGGAAHVGYRIAPWRELTITPSVGVELGHDLDLAGRVPGYTTCYPTIGLDVGWLF
jgi:hypothetical protein